MTLNLIPARYRNQHRGKSGLQLRRELAAAERKVGSLTAALDQASAEVEELRGENAGLRNLKAAADDTFVIQVQLIDDLEDDVRRLRAELADEQGARAVAAADVEARDRWIKDLEKQLAESERRREIGSLAEAAAARTQELDVRSLRERFETGPVVSLQHSPQAAHPAHVPSWAVADKQPEPAV